jgi:hypothetical protein
MCLKEIFVSDVIPAKRVLNGLVKSLQDMKIESRKSKQGRQYGLWN